MVKDYSIHRFLGPNMYTYFFIHNAKYNKVLRCVALRCISIDSTRKWVIVSMYARIDIIRSTSSNHILMLLGSHRFNSTASGAFVPLTLLVKLDMFQFCQAVA